MKKRISFFAASVLVLVAVCVIVRMQLPATNPRVLYGVSVTATTTLPTIPPPPAKVTFMAVGDNLIHKSLYTQAKARARHGLAYDFAPAYAKVKSLLARADLSFINQETVVAGAVGLPSSYPMFNSPTELGDTVYDLGFRAVCLSNNHMLDKGTKGALASLDYWAGQSGVVTFGAYRGMADFQTPRVLEVNGIKFAFVAATFSYNGLRLPQDSPLVMPLLEQEDVLRQGIATARAAADVVVVSLHWGVENSQTVIDAQRALAQKCVNWGADVILGSHPHVLQTMEFLTKPDGGHAFVIYSLGNFISAQNRAPNLVGGVLELTFEKPSGGAVAIRQPRLLPLVTQYEAGYSNVRLIPWAQYTPALANAHGVRRYDSRFSYHYIETLLRKTIPVEFLVME